MPFSIVPFDPMVSVSRIVSAPRCWLHSNCCANPRKRNFPWTPAFFIARHRSDGAFHLLQRGRAERRPTRLRLHGLPHHRGCSSLVRAGFPISSPCRADHRLVTRDGPDPKYSRNTFDHYAEIMNHFHRGSRASRATRFTGRIMEAPWVFAWALPIRTGSMLSSSRRCGSQRSLGRNWKTLRAFGRSRAKEARSPNLLRCHDPDAPIGTIPTRRPFMTPLLRVCSTPSWTRGRLLPTCHITTDNRTNE